MGPIAGASVSDAGAAAADAGTSSAPSAAPDAGAPAAPAASDAPNTPAVVVSLTFDDSYRPQVQAASVLEAHGLRGTFYVNSPQLHAASANRAPGAMSVADALGLQARGHEIGGHTLGHLSLTELPEAERVREIVADRAELVRLGLAARSFAYPYGHVEADSDRSLGRPVLEIARSSGYSSARDTNGVSLDSCDVGSESLPPGDAFRLRGVRSVDEPPDGAERRLPPDTADTLLGWVDHVARCGGGWLPILFHHLREDCSAPDAPGSYCFDFAELDRLASSLAAGVRCPDGAECYRMQVATVGDVIGGGVSPAREVPGLRNGSLERITDSGGTECLELVGDAATAAFSRSGLARTGSASERLELSEASDQPAELLVQRDFGECSIFVAEGSTYDLSLYYQADPRAALPTLSWIAYRLTSDYQWQRWVGGPAFTARSPGTWVRLPFATPAVPPGTIAISFGLRQESAGIVYVDDFESAPAAPE
jgi:peptidoglycan/xylan/chitin deacetylase (PgdA/CDA1 family)